ncbi:set domain [Pyrenophora seminiperda CCB06]|uniref:Set domain n=1 Tax=Pyrenophora seminiperda CCB06 TaxID=1302712 RepID=A0A3M7LXS6_9PLEO|nr:set domain [Pyrenophora seminiperda CCB06]
MSFLLRTSTLVRQRLFTTSARARHAISFQDAAAAHMASTPGASAVPRLGKVARWLVPKLDHTMPIRLLTNPTRYLPTMAMVAAGMIYFPRGTASAQPRRPLTLGDANANIGFGVTNALNEANRKVHVALEPTQEQRNQMLMDSYGERSSLEDMERALAGLEAKLSAQKDRATMLEEAYGGRASIEDLQRAMELYEVQ